MLPILIVLFFWPAVLGLAMGWPLTLVVIVSVIWAFIANWLCIKVIRRH